MLVTATSLTRRQFIVYSGLLPAASLFSTKVFSTASTPLLLSACDDAQGQHYLFGLYKKDRYFRIPVAYRAHAASFNAATAQAIFFARRPGIESYVVDVLSGQIQYTIRSLPNYHFCGHGCFSADSRWLFVSENAYERRDGVIGIYDVKDCYKRIGEFNSYGLDPHEIAWLPDQKTLVIANGGILTHPRHGRKKLNLDTMQSSLVYINSQTGKLLSQYTVPCQRLSLRHIAVDRHSRVIIGAQYEGNADDNIPLVFRHQQQEDIQPLLAEAWQWLQHKHYIASLAVNDSHQVIATSPRGNVISLWDLAVNKCVNIISLADVAGATLLKTNNNFIVSNGQGKVETVDAVSGKIQPWLTLSENLWDNHLLII